MLLKTDENLPGDVAEPLCELGFDCRTAHSQGLGGQPDSRISDVCRGEGRVLLTLDVGFANIRVYPPAQFPGFIVLRLSSQDTLHLLEVTARLARALRDRLLVNELWIVEDSRIRRRR